MLTLIMQETLTNVSLQRVCLYTVSSTGEFSLYSTFYHCIVYYRGRIYGHDGGYEGDNLASRVAR